MQIGGAARQISIREDFRSELMGAVNETLLKMKRAVKEDIERFKSALAGSRDREDQTYDHFASGSINLETYNRQRKRLQEEQVQYTNMMEQAQLSISDAAGETVESIIELATNAESHDD
jgi:small-conductance mechanosensitive channel